MKKLFNLFLVLGLLALADTSVSATTEQDATSTESVLLLDSTSKKEKYKKTLTQEEVDQFLNQQEDPGFGYGIVTTALGNQARDTTNCKADPFVYNFSGEAIYEVWGHVKIYLENTETGQYDYVVSNNFLEPVIYPTTSYGFKVKSISYPHYGLKMFWIFGSGYEVPGSTSTSVKDAYFECK